MIVLLVVLRGLFETNQNKFLQKMAPKGEIYPTSQSINF